MALPDYVAIAKDDYTTLVEATTILGVAVDSGLLYNGVGTAWRLQPSTATEESIALDISASSYTECYLSCIASITSPAGVSTNGWIELSGATHILLRIVSIDNNENCRAELWNGATYDTIGPTSFPMDPGGSDFRVDIRFKVADSGGRVVIRLNGVVMVDYTGDTLLTADTTVDEIKFNNLDDSSSVFTDVSGLIVHSAETNLFRILEDPTQSTGTFNNAVSGIETYVNQLLYAADDNLTYTANESGQGVTFDMDAANVIYEGTILGVIEYLRFSVWDDAAFYVKFRDRKSSTNYDSTGIQQSISDGMRWYRNDRLVDPSTGVAWASLAAIDAMEFGFYLDTVA